MRAIALACSLCLVAIAGHPRDARACINVVARTTSEVLVDLGRVERALEVGRPERAIAIAHRLVSEMENTPPTFGALARRAKFLRAVAIVRLDGRVRFGRATRARMPEVERTMNLAEAAAAIRDSAPDDGPESTARLGEALVRLPARTREGYTLLLDLHARDLLPDAFAYAALARASIALGEAATARVAADRCAERAGRLSRRICPRNVELEGT